MSTHIDFDHGISCLDADYLRPGLAAFYLLVERGQAAFIDTGTALSLPTAHAALRARGLTPADVAYVIPTHVHLDHAGGAGAMMRSFPKATLIAHPRGARHLIDPSKLMAGVTAVYGAEAAAKHFGEIVPIPEARVVEAPDNFTLDFNGRVLRFLDTPGHARHHFCVWDERSRAIFAGDTFGISYREFDTERGAFIFPTTTPVQFEPEPLCGSIDRLVDLQPKQIFLTHFSRVTEIDRLADDMRELVRAFADMARSLDGNRADRHERLKQGQRDLLLPRIRAHGCRLGGDQIEQLLA
ncbi:MAG: MBL fold metallo-hydrolase, partial [Pseudomonadota bacterium]